MTPGFFTNIAAAGTGAQHGGYPTIYALDNKGEVWRWERTKWVHLSKDGAQ